MHSVDNKLFWKTIKPFFKGNYEANIKIVEREEILQNESEIAEDLKGFLKNVVSSWSINGNSFLRIEEYKNISAPVQRAIAKFKSHNVR